MINKVAFVKPYDTLVEAATAYAKAIYWRDHVWTDSKINVWTEGKTVKHPPTVIPTSRSSKKKNDKIARNASALASNNHQHLTISDMVRMNPKDLPVVNLARIKFEDLRPTDVLFGKFNNQRTNEFAKEELKNFYAKYTAANGGMGDPPQHDFIKFVIEMEKKTPPFRFLKPYRENGTVLYSGFAVSDVVYELREVARRLKNKKS